MTMKALILTSCLVAALIAITIADIQEYSEEVMERINKKLELINVEVDAELVNSNTRIQFTLRDEPQPDAMLLRMSAIKERAPPVEFNICGFYIGIKLNKGQQCICNITDFGVEMDYGFLKEGVHNLQFIVHFESLTTGPILLDIPILKIPSSVNPDNEVAWAKQNHVGFLSPVSLKQLEQFHESKKLTLSFTWLRELLRYGVKKTRRSRLVGENKALPVYVPRPIALPNDILNKLWEELDWFKYDE